MLARRAAETAVIAGAGVLLAMLYGQDNLRIALLVVPPIVVPTTERDEQPTREHAERSS